MAFFGLVCTSLGFFIPALIAKRRQKNTDARLISALGTTSLLYHGTLHPKALFIDMFVAHSLAIHYLWIGIKRLVKYKQKRDITSITFGILSAHLYYNKSLPTKDPKKSRKWHMIVHITAQIAFVTFLTGIDTPKINKKSERIWKTIRHELDDNVHND